MVNGQSQTNNLNTQYELNSDESRFPLRYKMHTYFIKCETKGYDFICIVLSN